MRGDGDGRIEVFKEQPETSRVVILCLPAHVPGSIETPN